MNLIKLVETFDQQIKNLDKDKSSTANRRDFVKNAWQLPTKAVMSALAASMFFTPKQARAQTGNAVEDVLNFALTLEYLEDDFYKMALDSDNLIPGDDKRIFTQISKHETAHVEFLKNALGNNAIAKPTFDFTAGGIYANAFSDYATFLTLAQAFEDTGVRAYKGQAPNLMGNDAVLTQALQIHSVEGRHAAEVRWLRAEVTGQAIKPWIENNASDGAPQAVYNGEENVVQKNIDLNQIASISSLGNNVKSRTFDEPLTKEEVMAIVSPFINS
jgi:rubrerythrin